MSIITLANGKTAVQVNGNLVANRITRTGLSVREVARRCGTTFNIVYRITRNNEYGADLPLRHLVQLGQLLDLTVNEILDTQPLPSEKPQGSHPPVLDDPDPTIADDARRLAAALAFTDYLGGPDRIAQAFGWTLSRLNLARKELNAYLAPLGIKATNLNDHIYFTTTNRDERAAHERDIQRVQVLETQDRILNLTVARLLDDALNGTRSKTLRDAERPALGYAVNVGYLAPGEQNQRDLGPSPALLDAFPDL